LILLANVEEEPEAVLAQLQLRIAKFTWKYCLKINSLK